MWSFFYMKKKIDDFDRRILLALQKDATAPQREIAEAVGLSQNACWRRIKRLESEGILLGSNRVIAASELGYDLTVFVMIKTRHHTDEWADYFHKHISRIPEVISCYRIGGDWDYLLKVVCEGMSGYDLVYKRIISKLDVENITGLFSMESILENRPLQLLD